MERREECFLSIWTAKAIQDLFTTLKKNIPQILSQWSKVARIVRDDDGLFMTLQFYLEFHINTALFHINNCDSHDYLVCINKNAPIYYSMNYLCDFLLI